MSKKYPEIPVPNKTPMPRPVDKYFKNWGGPKRPEFKIDIDISKFTGNQKWQMHRYVMTTVEVDMLMFGRQIRPISYAYSVVMTYAFSAFVNLVMYYKLKGIDMVESLKSVE